VTTLDYLKKKEQNIMEKQEKGPFRNPQNVLEHSAQPPVNSINRPQLKLQEVPSSKQLSVSESLP